jgi:hypothetical protein
MAAPAAMRDLAALVVLVVPLARLARMRPRLLAVPVELVATLGLRAQVRPGLMVQRALYCRATVVMAAQAALEAPAETAVLVEQAGLAVVVPVRPAGLAWLPRVALAVLVASAVRASMQAL